MCYISRIALPGLVALLASCAASGPQPAPAPERLAAASYELHVLPASFLEQPAVGGFTLRVAPSGAGQRVDVVARGAENLRALYLELRYDASRLRAVSARASGLLAAAGAGRQLLELAVLDEPGCAVHGQVLAHPATARGFSGDGIMASFTFSPRPAAAAATAVRTASLAPAGAASAAQLSLDLENTELHWRYFNQGDYDQNSEVNIADLTPLGQHFGELGPFLLNSAGAVVDGDANGEINVADLTPIGANYGRRVSGYRIYESLDAGNYPAANEAPSAVPDIGRTALFAGDPAEERLSYSFVLAEVVVGAFYWVRPFDGDPLDPAAALGTPSNMVSAADPGNLPPVADVAANPALGLAPLQLRLSGADSDDPDGEIVLYEWDFDGDGSFDLASPESFCDHTIATPGEQIIQLRVTDNQGAHASDGVNIVTTAPEGWDLFAPFPNPYLDFWIDEISKPVLVQGQPALALQNDDAGLFYSRSTDQTGTLWAAPAALNTGGQYSNALALALVGGVPALAFGGLDNNNLYFMRASDAAGEAWTAPAQIVAAEGIYSPQLLVAGNGLPLAAMFGTAGDGVHIDAVLGEDAAGASWSELVVVEAGAPGLSSPNLSLIGGAPAVAYQDSAGNTIFALGAGDPLGSAWAANVVFDPPPLNGLSFRRPGLVEAAGRPAVAFGFEAPGEVERLAFVRADDAAGTLWPAPVLLGDGAELGASPALFSLDGVPAIVYSVLAGGGPREQLRIIRALDAEAAGWQAEEVFGEFPTIEQVYGIELEGGRAGVLLRTFADYDGDPRLFCRAVYWIVEH